MKTLIQNFRGLSRWAAVFLAAAVLVPFSTWAQPPVITAVKRVRQELQVTTSVPSDARRITLESRTRINAGAWIPRAVARPESGATEHTFSIVLDSSIELLRVRADDFEPYPASFYAGTNQFVGPPGGASYGGGLPPEATPGDTTDTGSSGGTRAVVESDIWKVDGDWLYFFNQYRGLQIVDIANPDKPVLRGQLALPASGEQMYLVPDHVILLAGACTWGQTESEIVIANVKTGKPAIVSRLPVSGFIRESRMVGTALYVASETYKPIQADPRGSEIWEWGTVVSSFDLADPRVPVARPTLWFPGSGNVIHATDRFLFVCPRDPSDWWHSTVRIIDISRADGVMADLGMLSPRGNVADKFKLNLDGDILTIVSEAWNSSRQWTSTLETFSLAKPASPEKLAELVIKPGERLFATRFAGTKAYVVTFLRIDPLFVIDLADPRKPRIVGEVEVPGWSTYIQPMGDRLLTIGIDNTNGFRVSVSLFDVSDPSKPGLLSRVPVGENYSWSEANTDEKAFGVLPEAGLLLVPYQGYSTNGYASRVQLIDFSKDALASRGAIEHAMQPRRATLHRDRVISLSGRELISVNAANRDQPKVTASLELAWRVDRVFLAGNHLLQLSSSSGWDGKSGAVLRVSLAQDPDVILNQVKLPSAFAILGAAMNDGVLHVLQGDIYGTVQYPSGSGGGSNAPVNVIHSTYLLNKLPEVSLAGESRVWLADLGWSSGWQVAWPKTGLVVWSGGGTGYGWLDDRLLPGAAADAAASMPGIWWPWYGGTGGRLVAFNVSSPASPVLVSDLNLASTNRWSFTDAYTRGNLLYIGSQTSEFIPGILPPGYTSPEPTVTKDPATGALVTNYPPAGSWMQRYNLHVVDYADPTVPTVRRPVSIPGQLRGVGSDGTLIHTVSTHFDPVRWTYDSVESLDVSVYDGLEAHFLDGIRLPSTWPHPVLIQKDAVLVGRSSADGGSDVIETWRVSGAGRIERAGSFALKAPAQSFGLRGSLLAVRTADSLVLLNAAAPPSLVTLGGARVSSCLGFDLQMADGAVDRGLWVPLGDYGVVQVGVSTP